MTQTRLRRASASLRLALIASAIVSSSVVSPTVVLAADKPAAAAVPSGTVGMNVKLDQLVLPGTELEVKPLEDRRGPMVVRIAASYPHGKAFRYDIVFYGLEPGNYDLRDSLKRKDGSSTADLPPIPVSVTSIIPAGQITPHPLTQVSSPWLGGYRLFLALAGGIWILGIAAILTTGRRAAALKSGSIARPVTLAEKLRPLVDEAMAGTLDAGRRAELERLLIGYWSRRLNLDHANTKRAWAELRSHEEAGPLLRQLEDWLHRPPGTESRPVDIPGLLKPYQGIQDVADVTADAAAGEPVAGRSPNQDRHSQASVGTGVSR